MNPSGSLGCGKINSSGGCGERRHLADNPREQEGHSSGSRIALEKFKTFHRVSVASRGSRFIAQRRFLASSFPNLKKLV